jgi:hypothetical protein
VLFDWYKNLINKEILQHRRSDYQREMKILEFAIRAHQGTPYGSAASRQGGGPAGSVNGPGGAGTGPQH